MVYQLPDCQSNDLDNYLNANCPGSV